MEEPERATQVRLITRTVKWFALGCMTGLFVVGIEEWHIRRTVNRLTRLANGRSIR